MSREEIEVKVKEIVAEKAECEISEVNDQTNLEETLGMDSLDRVELLMEMEKEFGITIPDDDADKVITTKDCVDLVERLKK
jgi:acyl carrier protein